MGITLSFRFSEAIHWTRKRIEKNACPTNPTASQNCSLFIATSCERSSAGNTVKPDAAAHNSGLLDSRQSSSTEVRPMSLGSAGLGVPNLLGNSPSTWVRVSSGPRRCYRLCNDDMRLQELLRVLGGRSSWVSLENRDRLANPVDAGAVPCPPNRRGKFRLYQATRLGASASARDARWGVSIGDVGDQFSACV
jgi:hypothetical protein